MKRYYWHYKVYFLEIFALFMLISTLALGAACTKQNENPQTSASGVNTATSAAKTSMTAAKTTSNATAKTGTNAVTGTVSSTSSETGLQTKDAESDNNIPDQSDDNAGSGSDISSDDIAPEEIEVFDLKGATINMAVYSANQASRPFWLSGYSAEVDMVGKRMDYVENKYNFKLVLNNAGAQKTQLILNAIAGTYWNDITFFTGSWLMECSKFLTPLDDYLDLTTANANINRCINFAIWDGRYYGVPWQNKVNYDGNILYNRAILEREGLPDLITKQAEGQWTWDLFLDIAVKTTKDTNSDGITDQWGFVFDSGTIEAVAYRLVASNFGSIITKDGDNYRFSLNEPKSINAIQFLSDLQNVYKVGMLKVSTLYKLGQAAMAFVSMPGVRTTKTSYPDTSAYLLYPKGPDADRYVNFSQAFGGWACGIPLVVNKSIGKEKIARVIYDLCALYDPTFPDHLDDVDVFSYLPSLFSEEDMKTVLLEKSITLTYGVATDVYCYLSGELAKPMFTAADSMMMKILNQNIPAATVIDSYEDMISSKIYDTLNKYNN